MLGRFSGKKFHFSLFLAGTFVALCFAVPAYRSARAFISAVAEKYYAQFEADTGLAISYDKLSPSILRGIKIRGVSVADKTSGEQIIFVRSVSVRYSLLGALQRDWRRVVSALVINGVEVDFSSERQLDALERLSQFLGNLQKNGVVESKIAEGTENAESETQSLQQDNDAAPASQSPKAAFNPDNFSAQIPVTIFLRNAVFRFANADFECSANISRASFAYSELTKDLRSSLASTVTASGKKYDFAFTTQVSAEGTLTDGFKNSLLRLQVSQFRGRRFSFGDINVLLSYEDRNVVLRSVENFLPLSLWGNYDLDQRFFSLKASADSLLPFSMVRFTGKTKELADKFSDFSVSGNFGLEYDVAASDFSYSSEADVLVPDTIFPGSLAAKYALSGDKSQVAVKTLSVAGERYDFSFSGNYKFAEVQLDGTASAKRILLPGGSYASGDLYFSSLRRGFECFAPEIALGDKVLNALEFFVIPRQDAVDFHVAVSDFLHYDSGAAGTVSVDGSFVPESKYFQASVSVANLYLDSVVQVAAAFSDKISEQAVAQAGGALSPYVLSTDLYVSGDTANVTYNVPYLLAANTQKDNEAMLLSLDGSNNLLRFSRLNLLVGGQAINMTGNVDLNSDLSGGFFSSEVVAGTVPYKFSGSVYDGIVSVTGDYGFSLQLATERDGSVNASVFADSFPVPISDVLAILSCDANLLYTKDNGLEGFVSRFEVWEQGNKFSFLPRVLTSGSFSKYGAFFDSVSYSDRFSSLEGKMSLLVNTNADVFSSAIIESNLKNPLSNEEVIFTCDISNPVNAKFSPANLKNDLYINSELVVNSLGLSRFMGEPNNNNVLTATATAIGSVGNPFVSVNVENFRGVSGGRPFFAKGLATLEDMIVNVNNFSFDSGTLVVENVSAEFSLTDLTGQASAALTANVMNRTVTAPLNIALLETERLPGQKLPTAAVLQISSEGLGGTLLTREIPAEISVIYGGDTFFISSSESLGVSGWFDKTGTMAFSVPENYALAFNAYGSVKKRNLDLTVDSIRGDAGRFFSALNLPMFSVYKGILEGSFTITGLTSDPIFSGLLFGSEAEFSVDTVVPERIVIPHAVMTLDHNLFSIDEMHGHVLDVPVHGALDIALEHWSLDYVDLRVSSAKTDFIPAKLTLPSLVFDGEAAIDLQILYQNRITDISGDVYVQNTEGRMNTVEFAANSATATSTGGTNTQTGIRTALRIFFGDHINLVFEPLLRCVLVPGTDIFLNIDQPANNYSAVGDVKIRSGEISWLSRNFYMRDGSLSFLENRENIDPLMNLRAETRERDGAGRDVRITMAVENQFLSDFSPRFTSVPGKSEAEIQVLLGQIGVGDSNNIGDLLFATGDYMIQSTVGRTLENSLRELLNFDIFSVRTNIVQNALRQSFNTRGTADWTVGNFFDNSTVYIGKYFGTDVFADALLRWTYDEARVTDTTTAGGIIFHPEIGLELASPFANIRWSVAPNIDAMMNNAFIPSTALTLSWSFAF